jgi:hypothetical protein
MKLSEHFTIQLLEGSLRSGIGTFLRTVLSLLSNLGPIVNVLVYSRNCLDGFRVTTPVGDSVVFRNFVTWDEIPNNLKMSLSVEESRLKETFESIIKRGERLWVGTIGDQLAIYNWTRGAAQSLGFF